jgi:Undecaprenyl-phosphate galactose phosphotransferase WbaP
MGAGAWWGKLRIDRRTIKKAWELPVALILAVVAAPLIGLLAVLVWLDSAGPVFYGHTRIGQGGKRFKAWKFRSMVVDADEVLRRYLEECPRDREEWARCQKLKNDPRITRIGRLLRRTSLDELPQVWNVLRGQMTLIGPRPIIESEIARYGEKFAVYVQATPGLSGLWQVSGRNNTTYEERVEMDVYYIEHASLRLDLYILARTVVVVISGQGAY